MAHYFGNWEGGRNYDPNLPPGYNKWDAQEAFSDEPEPEEENFEHDEDGNTVVVDCSGGNNLAFNPL